MALPLIGVTTYGRDEKNQFTLRAHYVDCVRRAGGIPLLIPPGEPNPAALLSRLDALILAGGGDLDPALYGGVPHAAIYTVDPERDRTEIALVKETLETGLPTLGICRGNQVINVALGGTLIEHLPDVVGEKVAHRSEERTATAHPIRLEAGSRLSEILEEKEFLAPSWHHQAIRRAGPRLKVVGRAPDGTVEAVEAPEHRWFFGVQWHPELAPDEPVHRKLFGSLVRAAAERKKN